MPLGHLDVDVGDTVLCEPQGSQPYCAAFWLDPFGVKPEAACHHDRE